MIAEMERAIAGVHGSDSRASVPPLTGLIVPVLAGGGCTARSYDVIRSPVAVHRFQRGRHGHFGRCPAQACNNYESGGRLPTWAARSQTSTRGRENRSCCVLYKRSKPNTRRRHV